MNNQENLPESNKPLVSKKILIFFLLLFPITILLVFLGIHLEDLKKLASKSLTPKLEEKKTEQIKEQAGKAEEIPFRQWVNCDDVRDVIEEENKLYVACLGGVLVVDKNSGKVIEQITMTNGLGNATTTSLVKRDDNLYIGTQDGFTRFNLKTKEAKKFSVEQGLVNGANIELAEDEEILWVGTFDGLSKFNTKTSEITNFREELAEKSTAFNVSKVLVTKKAVYVIVLASSYSPGGIARFDKESQIWEKFGPEAFLEKTDQNSRVDFWHLANVGNKVFVADFNNLWETEDRVGASWQRLDEVIPQILKEDDDLIRRLISMENEVDIIVQRKIYGYNPETGTVREKYPSKGEKENLFTKAEPVVARNGKLWLKLFEPEKWLQFLKLDDFQIGSVDLVDRPLSFENLVAFIDKKPIITAKNSIWQYKEEGKFKKLLEFGEKLDDISMVSDFVFQPVKQSSKIFIFGQICGMGCAEPVFAIFDYQKGGLDELKIPENIKEKISSPAPYGQSTIWSTITYEEYNLDKNQFKFQINEPKGRIIFNLRDSSWGFEELEVILQKPSEQFNLEKAFCLPFYEFEGNNTFVEIGCSKKLESQTAQWQVDFIDRTKKKIWEIDKKTGSKKELNLPLTPMPYSPFFTQEDFIINQMTFVEDKLWIGTNRGLVVYNPDDSSFKLIREKDGLVSNDVTRFIVDGKTLWVLSHWGGLSQIFLKKVETQEKIIKARAEETILAIKDKDMTKLSSFVHPDKGVRFSAYAFVDPQKDLVFTAEQIGNILNDKTKYTWGVFDGTGEPITLTFEEYYGKFIYDQDFLKAPQVGYNQIIGQGNTINNSSQVYPNSIIVEYHFSGLDPQYAGMDWESLRLVFEEKDDSWYLVGIIHNQWTI